MSAHLTGISRSKRMRQENQTVSRFALFKIEQIVIYIYIEYCIYEDLLQ